MTPPKRKVPRDMLATEGLKAELRGKFDVAFSQATGAISLAYLRGEHAGITRAVRILRRHGNTLGADLLIEETGYEC